MRVTLDTAILVRTITAGIGPARGLLDAIASSDATLVLSRYILDELLRVINYPRPRSSENVVFELPAGVEQHHPRRQVQASVRSSIL